TPAQQPEEKEAVFTAPQFMFTLLEALSATGLRAIRYAKEIPLLRYVVANDLSSSAVADIKRNIEYNGLAPKGLPATTTATSEGAIRDPKEAEKVVAAEGEKKEKEVASKPIMSKAELEELTLGKVRANEGDACVKMYNHRAEATRFDCIDLDPYGSAVPFLDAAIGAVADGGLMCITCTDMGVLAGHNYPEKCFTHYGGVCVNAEYSHEVALRLVLNSLATTAARYGRHIEPLLSLSIDFYVRLFIRVSTSPKEVKALPTKTSLLYYCTNCQSPHLQPFGRVQEKVSAKSGATNLTYHIPAGPPAGVSGDRCGECGGKLHIGGPMWSAPIHNKEFVGEMLEHVQAHASEFGTSSRIEGMLTIAKQELEAPLYFSPTRVASFFHCTSPPLNVVASALLNGGFQVSRSHAFPGSLKTTAPRTFVHDIMREWIKAHPIKMENIKEGSPARKLLSIEQTHTVDLSPHPDVNKATLSNVKLVRYQINPTSNWGPAKAAVKGGVKGAKSKAGEENAE
ncbi:S-adenosyl-L-methionine-dependent methyltransferase, partial [Leucosporidium creatinivorum]